MFCDLGYRDDDENGDDGDVSQNKYAFFQHYCVISIIKEISKFNCALCIDIHAH